jgi:predicted permease
MLTSLLARARNLLGRRRLAAEIDDELRFHVEQEIDAHVARGLPRREARRLALRDFGGVTQTAEAVRDLRAVWPDAWWRDIRYAVRSLLATPAFTIVAVGVLTLSIGATTAIFSVVDAVVLRRLPFPEADRLVALGEVDRHEPASFFAAPQNFLDWRAQQTVFTGLTAVGYASISLKAEGDREPEVLETQAVTADFFAVLGSTPLVGRTFTAENEVAGRARVAVISYGLWQRRFGGAPDVVGRVLPGQRADFEIVGVMPPAFAFPVAATRPTEVWIPNVFNDEDRIRGNSFSYRLQVIARLREGVSLAQAQGEMDRITAKLAAETPRWFEDRIMRVEPLRDRLTHDVRAWMLMLLAAVGFVLLIACANLATLMLARVSARGRELAVRAALGASRWDVARALLVEGLLLSLAGAAVGVFAAWLGVETLRALVPAEVPRAAGIAVDLRVLLTAVGVSIATGVLFSAAPIVQLLRPAPGGVTHLMRTNTAPVAHHWLRGVLVTAEVALAVVLLVGAALFLTSFARVSRVDLGLDPRDVLTVRIRPLVGAENLTLAQQRHRALLRNVLERVRALPGVEVAALVGGGVPLRGDLRTIDLAIPGRVLPPNEDLDFNEISPDYFRAMRVPVLAGRAFTDADREGSEPVVIINDRAAKQYFPGEDPLGRTIQFLGTRRIVGIVGNIRHDGPETAWRRQGFVPLDQARAVGATLVLRLSRGAGDLLPSVKAAIWSQFPGLALPDIRTLSQYLDGLIAERRFSMLLLGLFGVLGIVIACAGLYGVMAYIVAQRTQEIGIRMALGAVPRRIMAAVLGTAGVYLAAGLGIGLIGSWWLAGLVTGFLFQVSPHEPWLYLTVAAALAGTGLLAAFVPARRASRVDPLVALRLD